MQLTVGSKFKIKHKHFSIIDRIVKVSLILRKIDAKLQHWRPLHLCWLFEKLGLPIPRYLVGESSIDVGSSCINRDQVLTDSITYIDKDNPANASGVLTNICVYVNSDVTGLKIGIFYLTNGTTLKCRSVHTIGSLATGQRNTAVNMAVSAGDYIGAYWATGQIERSTSGVGFWDKSGDQLFVNNEQTYGWNATRAFSIYGTGVTIPNAPTNCVSSYVATNNAKCTWTDNSGIETNFRIEKAIDGAGFSFWKNVGAGVQDSGTYTLGANHRIKFQVRAYNAAGSSTYAASGYTYTTPSAPSGCTAHYEATDKSHCHWTDNSAYESGFDVDYRLNGGSWVNYQTTGANVIVSSTYTVGANKYIEWRVRSYRGSLYSTFSYSGIIYTTPSPPSGAVTHYVATNNAKLTWSDQSAYEEGFKLQKAIGVAGWTDWKTVGAGVQDSGNYAAGANTRAKFRVCAYKGTLYSTYSAGAYVYTIPTTPSGIALSWLSQDETVRVAWTDNSAYEQDFDIQKKTDGGSYGHLVYDAASPYDDTAPSGLDHRYIYRVRARCPDGRLSDWNTASTYMYSTPSIPTALALSWLLQDETVRVAYTKNHPYGDLDIYKAYDGGGSAHLVYDAASPYDDTAPTGLNHKYEYKIRARTSQNDDGSYEYSNFTAVAAMYSTPSIPTALSLAWLLQDETVRLTYTKNHPYGDLDIEKETDDGGFGHLAYDAASPYDDTAPAGADHKYEYKIRARSSQNADSSYEYSSFTSIEVIFSTPAAPTNCAIALGTINITWTDNSTYEEGFEVDRQLDGGGWGLVHTTAAEAEAWADPSQPTGANIKYEYRVRAKKGTSYSGYSTSNVIFIKTYSESIALSDTYLRVWSIYRAFTESISLSDVYSRICTIYRTFTESISLSDVYSRIWTRYRTFIESLSLTDTLQKKPAKTFIEAITLSDIYSRVWNIYRTFTEALNLADTLIKKPIKTFIESLDLADTLIKKPAKIFTESITLADTLKKRAQRIFTETLSLTDTVSKKAVKSFFEVLHLQDRYTRVVTWYRTFTENITLTDTIIKIKSNLVQLWKKLMNLFDIEG